MRRVAVVLGVCLGMVASHALSETKDKDLKTYLDGVTERGRALYEYDQAAWHGTDAFFALHPDTKGLARYICRKSASGWVVSFGKWNPAHDRFSIIYQATESGPGGKYTARKFDPPAPVVDDLVTMERALELAVGDFKGQKRPYNTAILPAPGGDLYVYIYPAQTKEDIYPLGGDVRYTVSSDGKKIIEKRELHKTILELAPVAEIKQVAGYHVHVLSDVPEDTDVLYVLNRKPSMPEYVEAGEHTFLIQPDGKIEIKK